MQEFFGGFQKVSQSNHKIEENMLWNFPLHWRKYSDLMDVVSIPIYGFQVFVLPSHFGIMSVSTPRVKFWSDRRNWPVWSVDGIAGLYPLISLKKQNNPTVKSSISSLVNYSKEKFFWENFQSAVLHAWDSFKKE